MATLEQIIEEARALSPKEKQKLRQALDRELEQESTKEGSSPRFPTHEEERAWLQQHRDEYLGQWVALDGGRLLAHGKDARTVYEAARAQRGKAPCIERVEPRPLVIPLTWDCGVRRQTLTQPLHQVIEIAEVQPSRSKSD